MDGGNGVKTIVYNTKKDSKKGGQEKRLEKRKRENSVLLVIVLGHVRGYFLHVCACNFFFLTLYTNIFILDSD